MTNAISKNVIETDVLIAGAGPVGVVLARLLADRGVRVLVIDRETDVMRIPRAIALDDDGGRVLQALGEFARLRHGMPRIERVRMISPGIGDIFSYDANCWRNANPMVLMFRQPELEDALREGLLRSRTASLRTGVVLETFTTNPDGVTATLRSGDGSEKVRAKYLIGCDGARSTVRKLLGVGMIGSTYEKDWLVVDVRRDPAPNREVHFLCDPRRPGVTMPAPEGGRRWEFMLGDDDDRTTITSRESLERLLAPWGDITRMDVERAAVYTFHARVAENFQRGRVFLAGDAAHLTPPFAGQGLMAGLRDAQNLAWKIAAVVHGDASDALLQTYETERLPNARTMVRLAKLMGEIIMARSPARCAFRDHVLSPVGRLPGLRQLLSSLDIKPRTRIPAGFISHSRGVRGYSRGVAQAGDLLPQTTLLDAQGTAQLLDDRIGYRWALIGVGTDPAHHLRRDQQHIWQRYGTTLALAGRDISLPGAVLDHEGTLVSGWPQGTCLIARPDRHLYAVVEAVALERHVDALLERFAAPAPPAHANPVALLRKGSHA